MCTIFSLKDVGLWCSVSRYHPKRDWVPWYCLHKWSLFTRRTTRLIFTKSRKRNPTNNSWHIAEQSHHIYLLISVVYVNLENVRLLVLSQNVHPYPLTQLDTLYSCTIIVKFSLLIFQKTSQFKYVWILISFINFKEN